jgi:hypothetical protein
MLTWHVTLKSDRTIPLRHPNRFADLRTHQGDHYDVSHFAKLRVLYEASWLYFRIGGMQALSGPHAAACHFCNTRDFFSGAPHMARFNARHSPKY